MRGDVSIAILQPQGTQMFRKQTVCVVLRQCFKGAGPYAPMLTSGALFTNKQALLEAHLPVPNISVSWPHGTFAKTALHLEDTFVLGMGSLRCCSSVFVSNAESFLLAHRIAPRN